MLGYTLVWDKCPTTVSLSSLGHLIQIVFKIDVENNAIGSYPIITFKEQQLLKYCLQQYDLVRHVGQCWLSYFMLILL